MKTALVLRIHPEPSSFTGAWADASAAALEAAGYEVLHSDPHLGSFDPALRREQYPDHQGPFDPLKVTESAPMPPEVATEVDQLLAADLLVIHFPMWWFGPPAMLKGWLDRVLVHGLVHDVDRRFDTGVCRGKKVLFCVSTGSRESESGPDGKEGNFRLLLWPLAYAFRYCGFDVLEPLSVHGVHGYHRGARLTALHDRLRDVLATQAEVIANLGARPAWAFNADTDFDETGRLKPGAPSHSPFIRRG
ncbi:NAD(P)H-dependent oxidoreductase [Oceanibium sediminis]|uniref:NAD(P)H-dependent oxidoreductase n=1 Tax=Oceanibium sediminis TaxID=2026339 RepID=UPI000DD395C4|nr:NAD(P)H-dependent oxidoreductase [Oceanibium sediminis]